MSDTNLFRRTRMSAFRGSSIRVESHHGICGHPSALLVARPEEKLGLDVVAICGLMQQVDQYTDTLP